MYIHTHTLSHTHTLTHTHTHTHTHSLTRRYNHKSDLLGISWAQFKLSDVGTLGQHVLSLLSMLRLVTMETGVGENKDEVRVNNLTIINFVLRLTGPTHEQTLTLYMLSFQLACSGFAFFIRYGLVTLFYP